MKSHKITSLLLAAILISVSCASGDPAGSKAPLQFVQQKVSLGTLRSDQAVTVVFKVLNQSTKPIKIVSADGGCRCTALISAPDQIEAHETGTFKFLFSASRSDPGPVLKMVTIDAEDGEGLVGIFTATVK
jgi:hypothetical protein